MTGTSATWESCVLSLLPKANCNTYRHWVKSASSTDWQERYSLDLLSPTQRKWSVGAETTWLLPHVITKLLHIPSSQLELIVRSITTPWEIRKKSNLMPKWERGSISSARNRSLKIKLRSERRNPKNSSWDWQAESGVMELRWCTWHIQLMGSFALKTIKVSTSSKLTVLKLEKILMSWSSITIVSSFQPKVPHTS